MTPFVSPGPRGGIVLARDRNLVLGNEPGGPTRTEGGGILMIKNSNSNGAEFFVGPGLVRVRSDCIIASPGNAILIRYKGVLRENAPGLSGSKGPIQGTGNGVICRPCGVQMFGAVGFRGDVRFGPFTCVRSRGSVLGVIAALVTGAGNRKGTKSSF